MQLNPKLLQHLELTSPESFKGLFLWLHADTQLLPTPSEQQQKLLSEIYAMTPETCYETLSQLELPDLVRLSILNEFGPQFADKPGYNLLETAACQRLLTSQA
ncbi:MAG TPA: hypothetical protein V6C99_05485 [Oculatellaceae cyanobacterium]|jgi:hypothetical protein